jgi:hypothetical protein
MTDKVTKALLEELSLLRAKLQQTDIYKEIQILERMIARRHSQGDSVSSDDGSITMVESSTAPRLRPTPISQVKARVIEMLAGSKLPISTKDIFTKLEAASIVVPGDSPQNNLSAHLSRDDTFVSWGRSGWTLATEVSPETEAVEKEVAHYVASLPTHELHKLKKQLDQGGEEQAELKKVLFQSARQTLRRNLIAQEEVAGLRVARLECERMTQMSLQRLPGISYPDSNG